MKTLKIYANSVDFEQIKYVLFSADVKKARTSKKVLDQSTADLIDLQKVLESYGPVALNDFCCDIAVKNNIALSYISYGLNKNLIVRLNETKTQGIVEIAMHEKYFKDILQFSKFPVDFIDKIADQYLSIDARIRSFSGYESIDALSRTYLEKNPDFSVYIGNQMIGRISVSCDNNVMCTNLVENNDFYARHSSEFLYSVAAKVKQLSS